MVGGANVRNVHASEGREAAGAKKGGQACNRKHCAHAEYRGLVYICTVWFGGCCWQVRPSQVTMSTGSDAMPTASTSVLPHATWMEETS